MSLHAATLRGGMLVIFSHCRFLGPSSVSCLPSQVGLSPHLQGKLSMLLIRMLGRTKSQTGTYWVPWRPHSYQPQMVLEALL